MSATINDKFNKAGDGNGSYPTLGKVSAVRSSGDSILTCEDLSGWATDTAVHFSTYKLTADGVVDPSTQTDWKGVVSGNTITNLTRICGAADTGNAVGDVVELNPTLGWLSDLVSGILTSHNQNGSIKDSAVGSSAIADGAITTSKLASCSVTSSKVDFATLDFGNYSTTEKNTGFTWIDGRAIYKKTVSKTVSEATTEVDIPTGITSSGTLVKVEATMKANGGQYPIPVDEPGSWGIGIRSMPLNLSSIKIKTNQAMALSTATIYATVYYTKY